MSYKGYSNYLYKKYGSWTVTAFKGRIDGKTLWEAKCDCGAVRVWNIHKLIAKSKTCPMEFCKDCPKEKGVRDGR